MPLDELAGFLWKALKKDLPGEMLTTTGQFSVDKWAPGGVGLAPNATGEDYLKQMGDTIIQTLMQSGMMGAGTGGASRAMRFMRERGYSPAIAEADAEAAKRNALDAWAKFRAETRPPSPEEKAKQAEQDLANASDIEGMIESASRLADAEGLSEAPPTPPTPPAPPATADTTGPLIDRLLTSGEAEFDGILKGGGFDNTQLTQILDTVAERLTAMPDETLREARSRGSYAAGEELARRESSAAPPAAPPAAADPDAMYERLAEIELTADRRPLSAPEKAEAAALVAQLQQLENADQAPGIENRGPAGPVTESAKAPSNGEPGTEKAEAIGERSVDQIPTPALQTYAKSQGRVGEIARAELSRRAATTQENANADGSIPAAQGGNAGRETSAGRNIGVLPSGNGDQTVVSEPGAATAGALESGSGSPVEDSLSISQARGTNSVRGSDSAQKLNQRSG
ncbi:MAG: hypothetical protein LBQ62_08995, partial [Candidatus Accumulibacter sp.]|nr:hypothetical protein [Accumulibacter sp.]